MTDFDSHMSTPVRLAIFTSHPIQYQAPWFRALALVPGLELKVFFSYLPDATRQGVGFGKAFEWDVPLLEGYAWQAFEELELPPGSRRLLNGAVQGLGSAIQNFRPDVALILGWHHFSLVQALLTCRMKGVPIVLRGESNNLRRRPVLVRLAHRLLFAQCDAFLAIGEANAALYRSAGVAKDKIFMARYFVDNDFFSGQYAKLHSDRKTLRAEFNVAQDSTCFCFVGKLEPKKRVTDFIAAFRKAFEKDSGISALIVGSGEMEEMAKAAARDLPIAFAGFLNQSEISKAYACADVLVLPSDYGETWGLVVNEAMVCGLPAVVSERVGCAHDLTRDEETGFVCRFGDIEDMAAKMVRLSTQPELRRALGNRARTLVMSEYTITRAIGETLAVVRACKVRHDKSRTADGGFRPSYRS
jgi:glycosyltransferase involved in cell wall biosynthesis